MENSRVRDSFLRALHVYATMVAYDVGDDPFDYTQDTKNIHAKWTQEAAKAAVIAIFDSVANKNIRG